MKTFFSLLFLLTISFSYAQLQTFPGSTGGSSGSGLTDGQYTALGASNGCKDGQSTANNPNWLQTYNSIVNNTAINVNYRNAYAESFMRCRNTISEGGPNDIESAECTTWNWSTFSFETGPCGSTGGGVSFGDGQE